MAGMSRKEIARLIDHIQPQGVNVTRTTKGVMLRLPDQSTTMLHFTGSDVREAKNVRARLKRAGVTWPTDGEALPDYLLKSRPLKSTLAKVSKALEGWDNRYISGAQLRRLMPEGDSLGNAAAQAALWHLGWTPTGGVTNRKWMRPIDLEPPTELDEEPRAPIPLHPDPQPNPEPDLTPAAELEPAKPDSAGGGPAREFIDTHDSWTATPATLPAELTMAQVMAVLDAFGLEGELRIWKRG